MAAYNKFDSFVLDLVTKVHNLNSDTLKVCLTNTLPVRTNTILSNITQLGAGNGYSTGGNAATFVSGADTTGTYKLVLAAVTFTAVGGNIGPFEYCVLYNSTPVNGNLIGWFDYGTAITITSGNSFTVQLDQTNGVFTLA